jgi:hypothetical protein
MSEEDTQGVCGDPSLEPADFARPQKNMEQQHRTGRALLPSSSMLSWRLWDPEKWGDTETEEDRWMGDKKPRA